MPGSITTRHYWRARRSPAVDGGFWRRVMAIRRTRRVTPRLHHRVCWFCWPPAPCCLPRSPALSSCAAGCPMIGWTRRCRISCGSTRPCCWLPVSRSSWRGALCGPAAGRRLTDIGPPQRFWAFCFCAASTLAWRQLKDAGIYLATNPSSSFFFLLTACTPFTCWAGYRRWATSTCRLCCCRLGPGKRTAIDVSALFLAFSGCHLDLPDGSIFRLGVTK